ncbi:MULTISPECIES: hypothetical protein [unclassified Synechocystis]|uniref:hypothetical protein n=1 Tax=unclassified Synechocystis TaxID=2640012 RepID=UPI0004D18D7E|nr:MULTISPECIES: hypothetical protein [unclassified Synechocystis]AIE73941.1 hypothetical protein D082_14130 [Synechocystis sp. PCC 6714]MCT0252508.1 hypothetical protein [Synechocystis sp. CS-94]
MFYFQLNQLYLSRLDLLLVEFNKVSIAAIAISGHNQEDAEQSKQEWDIKNLTMGYGLILKRMRHWALYISNGEFDHEPLLFCEPFSFWLMRMAY